MSDSFKLGATILLGVVAVYIVLHLLSAVMSLLVPLAVIAGIGLVIYGLISRKALGGGNGRYLP